MIAKIWVLEGFRGKIVFQEGSRVFFLKFWEWSEGPGAKDRALAKYEDFGDFWVNFWGIWSG
jgi:hypothetical protein